MGAFARNGPLRISTGQRALRTSREAVVPNHQEGGLALLDGLQHDLDGVPLGDRDGGRLITIGDVPQQRPDGLPRPGADLPRLGLGGPHREAPSSLHRVQEVYVAPERAAQPQGLGEGFTRMPLRVHCDEDLL